MPLESITSRSWSGAGNLAVVLVATKKGCDRVAEAITSAGFTVAAAHGNMRYEDQQNSMDGFMAGNFQVGRALGEVPRHAHQIEHQVSQVRLVPAERTDQPLQRPRPRRRHRCVTIVFHASALTANGEPDGGFCIDKYDSYR